MDVTANSGVCTTTLPTNATSTEQTGNILPEYEWTGKGPYGSNTNPVAFGNWAVNIGDMWSQQQVTQGYYQNPEGTTEMYFSSSTDAETWLKDNGYNSIASSQPSQKQPYEPNVNGIFTWKGVGWYDLSKTTVTGIPPNIYYINNKSFIDSYNFDVEESSGNSTYTNSALAAALRQG